MSGVPGLTEENIVRAEEALAGRPRSPWYIEAFLAFGGWIAGLLAAGAIFALGFAILPEIGEGEAHAVFALAVGGALALFGARLGGPGKGGFARHFAIAAVAAGFTAATAGVWYLSYRAIEAMSETVPDARQLGVAGCIAAAALALSGWAAARRLKDPIFSFLVSLAVYGIGSVAANMALSGDYFHAAIFDPVTPVAALAGLILFTRPIGREVHAAAGAALMIGPMILYDLFHFQMRLVGIDGATRASPLAVSIFSEALIAAGIGYCLWLLRERFAATALAGAGLLLLAGAHFLPLSGAIAILILAAGFAANHSGLAAVGVVALAGFIARFYHDLSMTLMEKSALLAALGAATLAGALIFSRRRLAAEEGAVRPARRSALTMLGFALVSLSAVAFVNQSVFRLETAFGDARTIYLPLAPVDPRSLIQGDYMRLNFAQSIYPDAEYLDRDTPEGQVYLRLDENNVASFSRMAPAADYPAADEVLVNYRMTPSGAIRYCPESFFFQEGDADAYAAARFAVLRVAPSGATRLIALADETLTAIDPAEGAESGA